jgi:glycosyltransferase involved in cell wall biosynthesis
MGKIYIVYYDFKNTSGSHCGMQYLAKYIKSERKNIVLIKHIYQQFKWGYYLGFIYARLISLYLYFTLKSNDKVFFLEYCTGSIGFQHRIASFLRKHNFKNKFIGLIHLSGSHLMSLNKTEDSIKKKLLPLDKIIVFGSSLKKFLLGINVEKEVIKTFHYVDNKYYQPLDLEHGHKSEINVLVLGNIKRDFRKIEQIINASSSSFHFHVCNGLSQNIYNFSSQSKISEYGFLTEQDLLKIMQKCDVNLSVLEDTIGSNVITSSMALGHIQVVSDVGSIRDYCSIENAIFCDSIEDFISALSLIQKDKDLFIKMKNESIKLSKKFSIENFLIEFDNLVLNA